MQIFKINADLLFAPLCIFIDILYSGPIATGYSKLRSL